MNSMRAWMGLVAHGIQILAVLIMVTFIVVVTARWLIQSRQEIVNAYARYRLMLGRSLLLGLELLVAADIIETAAVELSLANLETLGALVVVRTALSWTLTVEIEGRWPWQPEKREAVVG
jgi:uncharacterized membrane protein